MSYAIANIIYGIPLMSNESEVTPEQEFIDDEVESASSGRSAKERGWLIYYSSCADYSPAAFGIELGEFDEACAYVDISTLKLKPTKEQKEKFTKLFNQLEPALQKLIIKTYGEPRVFFLWSTS